MIGVHIWLPVRQRIVFKIARLTFKACTTGLPTYLNRHLIPRAAVRTTHSSAVPLLTLPTMHTNFGRCTFTYSAPDVWNNLPPDVLHCNTLNTFKKHLKTRLMTCHQAPLKLCSTALYKFVYYYYYYYYYSQCS